MYVYLYIYIYIFVHIYVYIYIYMYIYIYLFISIYIYIYLNINICMYIYIDILIYIYIYKCIYVQYHDQSNFVGLIPGPCGRRAPSCPRLPVRVPETQATIFWTYFPLIFSPGRCLMAPQAL